MGKQIIKSDLGYLGVDFQIELVKCFIEDQPFFENLVNIVDQNMFTDDNLRRIVGFMKDRYMLTETVATYKDIDTIIRNKVSDAIGVERCLAMLETIKNVETRGIDLIEGCSEKFFKQQNLTKAINIAQEIIKSGDMERYNDIEDIIKKALENNNKQDFGYKVFDNMDDALSEEYRCAIPTGAENLDKALFGGLAKGELGVIIAPSSVGKTSATTGFAAKAATTLTEDNNYKGYKVVHIHFEDKPVNIKRKYYAYLTDFDACELSRPDVRPKAIEIINNHKFKQLIQDNVRGFNPYDGDWGPSEIRNKLRQLIAGGFKPDLLIIDYFECLKLEKPETNTDSEWTREGLTMRKLEKIANEFNIAVWCPVQGTKDSFDSQIVGMKNAGGSVKKTQIAHVIISFARTEQMRLENKLNIFLNKFRGGRISQNSFLNVTFNNGTTKFDFSTMTDVDEALDGSEDYQYNMATKTRNNQRK